MKVIFAILAAIVLLPVAEFCVFGFLATFEPTDRPEVYMAFRIGYGVVVTGSLATIIALFASAFRSPRTPS